MRGSGRYRRVFFLVVAIAVAGLFLTGFSVKGWAGRSIYINGIVLTMDPDGHVAQAVVVAGERIIYAGTNREALAFKTPFTRVVDLNGRTMIPGFVDAHSHFPGTGLDVFMVDLNSPPIGRIRNMEELKEALREKALNTRPGRWVAGMGYDDTLLAEKRHPDRRDLDQVSTRHPIMIAHISGHLYAANSMALDLAGIDKDTPDPAGGHIRRDPETGEPIGVLEESAGDLLMAAYPNPPLSDIYGMIKDAVNDYLRQGVTTAQNGLAPRFHVTMLSLVSRLGLCPLRLVVWPDADAGRQIIEGGFKVDRMQTDRFRVGAVKLIADGSIQGYTGYLTEPYYIVPDHLPPDYRGYPVMEREELIEEVEKFHCAGRQVAVHGNGDAAIDDILDAFENAQSRCPRDDARHLVIHAQMAREDQLDRIKELGVIPSFFVLHTYYWGDRHINIFMGPERAMRMSPARSAKDRGMVFTLHTDAPVVPMTPLLLVWSAVNRLSYGGTVVGADQRIDAMSALKAVTIDSARQMFLEDSVGSIEPGKLADLVILSANPLDDPEGIDQIRVEETIIGGRTVFRAL